MINRSLLIVAGLSTSLLGGCAGVNLPGIPSQIDTTIAQVQSIATTLCRFEPTVATVAGIIATFTGGGPIVDVAGSIAASICASVSAKSAVRGRVPTYRGVRIQGRRV